MRETASHKAWHKTLAATCAWICLSLFAPATINAAESLTPQKAQEAANRLEATLARHLAEDILKKIRAAEADALQKLWQAEISARVADAVPPLAAPAMPPATPTAAPAMSAVAAPAISPAAPATMPTAVPPLAPLAAPGTPVMTAAQEAGAPRLDAPEAREDPEKPNAAAQQESPVPDVSRPDAARTNASRPVTSRPVTSHLAGAMRALPLHFNSFTPMDTSYGSLAPSPAIYKKADPAAWNALKKSLIAEGFAPERVEAVFKDQADAYTPLYMAQKTVELYNGAFKGKACLKTDPKSPDVQEACTLEPDYQAMIGSMSLAECRRFISRNQKLLNGVYRRYGVPPAFVTGILLVETGIGQNLGQHSALAVLASMAVTDSLAAVRPFIDNMNLTPEQTLELEEKIQEKSVWARNELAALISYGEKHQVDVSKLPGSVYGAIGLCQFMPSNIENYGVDADGDKKIDLFKLPDAAYSVGSYLANHGWRKANSPQSQLKVLRSYNHSDRYAALVYGVATQIISPTTLAGTQGKGNAVTSVNRSIKSHMGGKGKAPAVTLPGYGDVLNTK